MTQIYGYAYHSPLVLMNLVPLRDHVPLYLDPRWVASDLRKNVEPVLKKAGVKTPVVLAGSLGVLQSFVRAYPEAQVKVVLFEFPGLVNPFLDPSIEWIDCDHQSGGAWQITKTKLANFEAMIGILEMLDGKGRDLILRMERFIPKDRTSEIERFAEYMPANYKELLEYSEEKPQDVPFKEVAWKKKTLAELLVLFMGQVSKHKRQPLLSLVLDYQLGKVTKRDYNNKLKSFIDNANAKKVSNALRKWMDDDSLGRSLFNAYLDYLCNLKLRSWKTILADHEIGELDLLILIAQQHRDSVDLAMHYADECKSIRELPSNMNLPEPTARWTDNSLNYHPEPPALLHMFELA